MIREQADRITEILAKAESEMQKVIVEAAQVGDYRTVDMARNAAINVRNLRAQISNPTRRVEPRVANAESRPMHRAAKRKAVRTGYPKFHVAKDTLIRIGWSKKQGTEYTHKTPKPVFDSTIKAMGALAQSGAGPFTAEQVIEQINKTDGETIPSYQVYVVIGMLRLTNCIEQIGREGYNIPSELAERANRKWSELSNRQK